ncbi:hypothetical protein RvY_14057 [Ramazzottius varieornatus]|uniref:Nuclear cap-binding protein subunit 2 n=1 Tax=Ramazzottius varieornatus TaxID=947166 RepID=A0A1D1VTY0_RAMVA|nr:hypothetical protein RvY_14057 [Ramazzottius varieornatus]
MSASKRNGSLSAYRDQQFQGSMKEQEDKLRASTTLYVGNLSFFTTEDQIHHLFSKSGDVKRCIIGLDRFTKTPCGFCFVEYYRRADAEDALRYVNGTRLDERVIRCDWDAGFIEGRQYGRGKSGGQVRDEFRTDYDGGRGGFGKMIQNRMERIQAGDFAMAGGTNQRRSFGKRKWEERNDSESQEGEDVDKTTDLRLKLRKMRGENGEEVSAPEQEGMAAEDNGEGAFSQVARESGPAAEASNTQPAGASSKVHDSSEKAALMEDSMAERAAVSEEDAEDNVVGQLAGQMADQDKQMDWS